MSEEATVSGHRDRLDAARPDINSDQVFLCVGIYLEAHRPIVTSDEAVP
jgi:hypothetical protein